MSANSALEIKSLIRCSDPHCAAAATAQRLIHIVAEWNEGSGIDLTFASEGKGSYFAISGHGSAQPHWKSDLTWVFEDVARLRDRRSNSARKNTDIVPTSVLEILPTRELLPATFADWGLEVASGRSQWQYADLLEERTRVRTTTPWPTPLSDDLFEVAKLLAQQDHLMVRFRLSPATRIEMDMLADSLNETWSGSDSDLYHYLGRPIRMRALLASTKGDDGSRLRSLARRWATALSVVVVPPDEAAFAWNGPESSLMGHAVPEGVALSLLKVPATGNRAFPGMPTEHDSVHVRPLDPVPSKPSRPIRLGQARSVNQRNIDVSIGADDLLRHAFIEGSSGSGKSTLIAALARGLSEQGFGYTLLDPHGETVSAILRETPAGVTGLNVIRHEDSEHPIPLDIFTGNAEQVERVIDSFVEMVQMMYDPNHEGMVGARWRRWFGLLAQGTEALLGERASLVAVSAIAGDRERINRLASALSQSHRGLSQNITNEIGRLPDKEANEMLSWAVSKLQPLISTTQMRAIIGTGYDAVDVGAAMDDGESLLIDLASPVLGVPSSRMLGALWLLKHWLAMGKRQDPSRPHFLIVDEAHLFQYGALPALIAEGRKFGIGVIVATQHMGQLSGELSEALESNAGSFITLRTGLKFAARASKRLNDWPVEELVRLPTLNAAASLLRNGTPTEPFTLIIDHHDRMKRQQARDDEAAQRGVDLESASVEKWWSPFSHLGPITESEIDEALTVAQPSTRRSSTRPGPRPGQPSSSFLDEWLEQRNQLAERASAGFQDTSPPVSPE